MDISHQKEEFNIAYVRAIAAQAGFSVASPSRDNDSVDMIIVSAQNRKHIGAIRSPKIDLQLKCTSQDILNENILRFPLPIKNYNDLRGEDFANPRYLFVLVVPAEPESWITYTNDSITLNHACYWLSMKDLPPTANTQTVTVEIPISQRLTTAALELLMDSASKGEWA